MIGKVEAGINSALKNLLETRDELEAELAEMEAVVSEIKAGISRINKVLKAAEDTNHRAPQAGKKVAKDKWASGKSKSKDIKGTPQTIERSQAILALMLREEQEDWTVSEIQKATGFPLSGVNVAVTYMRQEGMIRATRVVQGGGHAYATYPE